MEPDELNASYQPDGSGIASQESSSQYVDEAYGIQNSCMSAEDRVNALTEAANRQLEAQGVPPLTPSLEAGSGNLGQLNFQNWSLGASQEAYAPEVAESVTPEQAADAANTIYHEARHGEQWYRMAQLQAGLGKSPEEIAEEMQIPLAVAQSAAANPILESNEAEHEAEKWHESVYGANSTHREEVLNNEDSEAGVCRGRYDDYRQLPEEADAWQAGGQVTQQYLNNVSSG